MNVLSLYDGMSGGQIALQKLGVKVDNYYASEIDKYAIQIAKKNFPNTIYLGDVKTVNATNLQIDLLMGGSPCQGFSRSRSNHLNFEDPRSKLFFEFVRILEECNPKYFLLENVLMNKECQDIITAYVGVEPIRINSNLVSAQSRERLYWTNIPNITQPKDRNIFLKDIIDEEVGGVFEEKYLYEQYPNNFRRKSLTGVYRIGPATHIKGHDLMKRVYDIEGKSPTLNTCNGGNREPKIPLSTSYWRRLTPLEFERLQTVPDNYTEGVSNTQRYKMLGNGWTIDVITHLLKSMEM